MADVGLQGGTRVFAGGVTAVRQLDLRVSDGELLVLVGPSGCGKSTTLRLIAGLEEVTTGEIWVGGRCVNSVAPKDRNLAMVFQNYALYPHMTARENMAFGLRLRYGSNLLARLFWRLVQPAKAVRIKEKRKWIADQVDSAARSLGIEHLLDRLPRQLSGGERQRGALGRAMVRQPAAFLLDEPLSNLDAKLRVEMRRELRRLHRELRATMIYVTHDQVEALTLGQRIVVMDHGAVQQVGTPREVYDRPSNRFVAGFLGSPPMNFMEGVLQPTSSAVRFCGEGFSLPIFGDAAGEIVSLLGRPLVLGIRPEDVVPVEAGDGSATVSHLEPMGDATVVYLQCGRDDPRRRDGAGETATSLLTSKVGPRTSLEAGSRVSIEMDINRVHFFDPESGENIGPYGEITEKRS